MSAIELKAAKGANECAQAAARVIPLNKAISAQGYVYPLLMIGGVYRASFAMGLAVYALPALPASTCRHRARLHVRRARHALRQTFNPSSADMSPRDHEP
ncbi:hypothetical protein V1291_004816 [Nitrobacteraceae bacterium AZCC 1564]